MVNEEIRMSILKSGLKQWQIANALGMAESNFSAMLRNELADEKKEVILKKINEMI